MAVPVMVTTVGMLHSQPTPLFCDGCANPVYEPGICDNCWMSLSRYEQALLLSKQWEGVIV